MTTATKTRSSSHSTDRRVSRRSILTAVAAGGVATTAKRSESARGVGTSADIHIRVYPGPVPLHVWARYGGLGMRSGWPVPFRAALTAIENATKHLVAAIETTEGATIDARVERGEPISFPYRSSNDLSDAIVPTQQHVLDVFRDQLLDRDAITGTTSHVLLWWGPTDYSVGYGGTRTPNGHVARAADEGAQTVANVGATEVWDSRHVTQNLAIHETFHTILSSTIVETIVDSRCDHDLGTVTRTETGSLRVSPMATAYAGPDRIGGETRWQGSGCYNHDTFYRHDGFTHDDRWEHTPELSDGTIAAASEYVIRYLIDKQDPPDAIPTATRS